MLGGNSQLDRVYHHAWILNSPRIQAVTGNEFFRTIVEEILDYVIREMIYVSSTLLDGRWRESSQ